MKNLTLRIVGILLLAVGFAFALTPSYNGASIQVMDVDGGSTAATATLTASAGSNRFLEVTICTGDGTPTTHTGATWGGAALTQRGSALSVGHVGNDYGRMSKWYLKEANFPGGASGTINVTLGANQGEVWVVGVLYSDVDQTNPYKNAAMTTNIGQDNSNATITVTSDANTIVTASTWEIDQGGAAVTVTNTAGTTRQEADIFTGGYEQGSVADIAGGASDATISWTYALSSGTVDDWGAFGDALQYGTGGGGGGRPPSGILTTGAGK